MPDEDVWQPRGCVTAECVRHMQSRIEVFRLQAKVGRLKRTELCATHMCRWIRDMAAEHDAKQMMKTVGCVQPVHGSASGSKDRPLHGFDEAMTQACIPHDAWPHLKQALVNLGAHDVREPGSQDWMNLQEFQALRPLEQRRLLTTLGRATQHN
eukprot:4344725-Karenia_brevis.AAC.1